MSGSIKKYKNNYPGSFHRDKLWVFEKHILDVEFMIHKLFVKGVSLCRQKLFLVIYALVIGHIVKYISHMKFWISFHCND